MKKLGWEIKKKWKEYDLKERRRLLQLYKSRNEMWMYMSYAK